MPFSLPLFIEPVHFAQVGSGGGRLSRPYRGGRWKILLIGADERYLPTDNGTLFSTGNHPVETLLPMYHLDKAGFAFEVATLSGNPVKFEWWAMPTEDEAVVGLYGKYQGQFRQPAKLADLLAQVQAPTRTTSVCSFPAGTAPCWDCPRAPRSRRCWSGRWPTSVSSSPSATGRRPCWR